jgi:hypothetical protein
MNTCNSKIQQNRVHKINDIMKHGIVFAVLCLAECAKKYSFLPVNNNKIRQIETKMIISYHKKYPKLKPFFEENVIAPGGLFLYLGIHRRTARMENLFDQSNISLGCNFHQSVISMGR